MTEYYWFDSKNVKFYGPNTVGHSDLYLKDAELIAIIDKLLDSIPETADTIHDVLLSKGWVRVYYNDVNEELGIQCEKHIHAIKAAKAFVKQIQHNVKSLFLDINEICIRQGLEGDSLSLYLKTGRIKHI